MAVKVSGTTVVDSSRNLTNIVDAAVSGNMGVGTASPTNKLDIFGNVPLACQFTSTTSGTTMDVTVVNSGALAVGQTVSNGTVTARITALGTGSGGVGTYTLDRDMTGTALQRSFLPQPNTLRIGNSSTTFPSYVPNGSIEFYGSNATAAPRAIIRSTNGVSAGPTTNLDFMVATGSAEAQDPVFRLTTTNAQFSRSLILGLTSLLPANVNNGFSNIGFRGRNGTLPTSGTNLGNLGFIGEYVDAGTTYGGYTYGQFGYVVDGSFSAGQLPSAFTVQTRSAAGTTAERFRIDKDGNVGVGVIPSAWSGASALEVSRQGSALLAFSANNTQLTSNAYFNGTNWIYAATANASYYQQNSGGHIWWTAPSGTAGNTITWTRAMTLDASGNLGVGTASPSAKLDVTGTTNLNGAVTVPDAVTTTADDDGTFSSGTYTPTPVGGNMKRIVNGGAFTLAAPTASGDYSLVIQMTNNASAGAVTFSGFNKTAGATLTTTNGDDFLFTIVKINGFTYVNTVALQ